MIADIGVVIGEARLNSMIASLSLAYWSRDVA